MGFRAASETVFVNTFTNGVLDPAQPMLGPVRDGGYIVANTAPGCWGPMITPAIRGGHEVTQPVYVEGARWATPSSFAFNPFESLLQLQLLAMTKVWRDGFLAIRTARGSARSAAPCIQRRESKASVPPRFAV